jgi:hypothetical protein
MLLKRPKRPAFGYRFAFLTQIRDFLDSPYEKRSAVFGAPYEFTLGVAKANMDRSKPVHVGRSEGRATPLLNLLFYLGAATFWPPAMPAKAYLRYANWRKSFGKIQKTNKDILQGSTG